MFFFFPFINGMVLSFENFNQANFRPLVFYCDFIKIQGH